MLLLTLLFASASYSQVSLSASGGPSSGTYSTLKAAFDDINSGLHTGNITITITGATTETASAMLNSSGTGSSNYSSVLIQPSGTSSITGAINGHLIDLNGADNVVINGLNANGNSLVITNTSIINSSTIRLWNDAMNNLVTNCTILGSAQLFGVVYFGSGISTGNDNNAVSNCNIGPAGANNPTNGIYSLGNSTIIDNSGNVISNNNIYDYFNTSASSYGIQLNSFNSGWTISGNRLFQTANRVYTTASSHYGINIMSGSGYIVTDNVIGYANANGTGTTNMIGLTSGSLGGTFPSAYTVGGAANQTKYVAIYGSFTAAGAVSSIQNNTIAGFALYTSVSTSTSYGAFCGIGVASGNVNVGTVTGNTIGTPASTIYIACTASGGAIAGIYVNTNNTAVIQNNLIQNLDAMGALSTTCGSINGINVEGSGGTVIVSGNTIGNSTNSNLRMGNLLSGTNLSNVGTTFSTATGSATFQGIRNAQTGTVTIGTQVSPNVIQNLSLNSSATGAYTRGIYSAGGSNNISYNTITNLSSATSGASYSLTALSTVGILSSAGISSSISKNLISNISITNTGASGYTLAGIVYTAPVTAITVSKNKIWGLSNGSTSVSATAPATAIGIYIRDGGGVNTSIDNNMISLGNGQSSNTSFIGIWPQYNTSTPTTLKLYYNTINIEGTVISGAAPTFCLQRGDISTTTAYTVYTIDAKNNIFSNTRAGGTGKHYTLSNNYPSVASSATGWPANASNYNVLNGNAATIGYWSADKNIADWKTASACDGNSLSGVTATFNNTATGDLHMNMGSTATYIESGGVAISGFSNDYDGDVRPGPAGSVNGGATAPDMGADEFDGVPFVHVIFNVDMSTAQGFIPGSDVVYLTGTLTGWVQPGDPGSILMTQVGSTLIYTANVVLAPGTYQYKYFKNAGWTGGEWNGGSDRSVSFTSGTTYNDTWGGAINWANLQWPAVGNISLGGAFDVYAQAYIPNGITAATGATYGLQAWIGFSTVNDDPSTWTNWIPAPFNGQAFDNDEFKADLGTALTSVGTYYYASRFKFGNQPYLYGGFNGGYWNGTTNVSGVLTIAPQLPILTTDAVTGITSNSAVSGGNITSDGGDAITARGVCWNTTGNPSIADFITTNGTGSGIFTSNLGGLTPGTPYYIRAYATNSGGTAYGNEVTFTTVGSGSKILILKLFLESLYSGGISMNQALGTAGPEFGSGIADKITVELHSDASPYSLVYDFPNINLLTNGTATITSLPVTLNGTYYVVVKNRNSIETWSTSAISFAGSVVNYDFSTSISKAYGDNLKPVGSVFVIYAGDATQDGVVDGSDMASIDNASTSLLVGYFSEDVNGDGIVDGSDMAVIDNNATSIVSVKKP